MTEEQAREAAWKATYQSAEYEDNNCCDCFEKGVSVGFDAGFDTALEYANRWTYCDDALPTEMGKYWITTQYGDMSQDSWNGVSWATYLPNHVIAWRPLPKAAEIKRSEDEV